jgi:hexosaminidase
MYSLKLPLAAVAILAIAAASPSHALEDTQLPLVPYPQTIQSGQGSFVPKKDLLLSYAKGNPALTQIAQTCAADLASIGFSASQNPTDPAAAAKLTGTIKLIIEADASLAKEGYRLKIDKNISISAATADGLFWGTRTLLQLLSSGPQKAIPQLTIKDQPEFSHRGLMIDNARKFHSIGFHLKMIKRMAALKINRYQIHFSDHQSYTLPSTAFPTLPTKDRHYTRAQIKQLVDAAQQYHVQIIPEIDVPGHAAALIRSIPSLACTATTNKRPARKLCIGKQQTYETLEKLFTEIMEMIPGDYWHLGADEVHYRGTQCTECQARMKQENLEQGSQLYHSFINRMHQVIKKKNRKMLVWEGFDPTLTPKIDQDIIVCPFDIKHKGHMPRDYFNAGYKILNTSWSPLYVADNLYMCTPEIIARWSPYMFGAGRSPQPFPYWKKFNPQTHQPKIIGAQMCSWDNEEKAEEGLLLGTGPGFPEYGRPAPRLQIMAERVWTGSKTTVKDLLERVGADYW